MTMPTWKSLDILFNDSVTLFKCGIYAEEPSFRRARTVNYCVADYLKRCGSLWFSEQQPWKTTIFEINIERDED